MSAYVKCPVILDWCGSAEDCGQCYDLGDLLEDMGIDPDKDTTWACPECCIAQGPTRDPITRMQRDDAKIHLGGFYQEGECYFCGDHSIVTQLVFFNKDHWLRWKEVLKSEPETEDPTVQEDGDGGGP